MKYLISGYYSSKQKLPYTCHHCENKPLSLSLNSPKQPMQWPIPQHYVVSSLTLHITHPTPLTLLAMGGPPYTFWQLVQRVCTVQPTVSQGAHQSEGLCIVQPEVMCIVQSRVNEYTLVRGILHCIVFYRLEYRTVSQRNHVTLEFLAVPRSTPNRKQSSFTFSKVTF